MPRYMNIGDAIDKNKISSNAVWVTLLEMQIVDPNDRTVAQTVRIVDNNEDVTFQGQTYTAANFTLNVSQKAGEEPSVTLTAQDQKRIIHQKLDDFAGGVFSNVIMRVVNTSNLARPAEVEEQFQVLSSTVRDYVVNLTLGAENPLSIAFPKHRQRQDQCAWRYRGYGCEYAGAMPSCDYSKDGPLGCRAHNNLANFRAIPGLVRLNI